MAKLDLNKAEDVLGSISKKQAEKLVSMFDDVKKDVEKQISQLGVTTSDRLREKQLRDLVDSINSGMRDVYTQLDGQLSDSILAVCQGVVDADTAFLKAAGIELKGAYASIPVDVLASIRQGKIYDEKWFLSNALWSDLTDKQRQINDVMARGLAMNESPLEIAKRLEKFVDPNASKPSRTIKTDYFQDPNNPKNVRSADYVKKHPEMNWDGWEKKTSRYSFGKVDYNAQRLARTAISHAYEQAIIQSAKANPMSEGIMWLSAFSERTCEICIERDGQIFQPHDIPLDHPNGMCTYEIVLPSMDDIADRLADWVNGKEDEGLDNWTDEMFGGKFELKSEFNDLQKQYLSKYGFTPDKMPSDFGDWSYKLSSADKSKLFTELNLTGEAHPFQKLNAWYDDNLASVAKRTVFTPTTAKTAPSSVLNNVFSKARKDAAHWFKGADAKERADGVLRAKAGEVWQKAKQTWKKAAYQYTEGSGKFNRPLRGYEGASWSKWNFKGVGNVDLNYEGAGAAIKNLTKMIDQSSYDFDIWLQRGVSKDGAAAFLGVTDDMLRSDSVEDLRKAIVGTPVTDHAFFSCAGAKGTGFSSSDVVFNVYCPEGTKMLYAEPFSSYSGDGGLHWDGKSGQMFFGSEFEVIIQRGTQYVPTKVEYSGGKWFIDLDVHEQI